MNYKNFMDKHGVKLFNLLIWAYFLARLPWQCRVIVDCATDFTRLNLIEFMSNYQGGFLRRGLLGELLFWFTSFSHIDFRWLAIPLAVGCFLVIVFFLWRKFKQYQIHWWLLPMSYCLGASYGCLIRKDFIIIALLAVMLFCLKSDKIKLAYRFLIVTILSVIVLLMYEPAFFMFIPILWLTIWRDNQINISLKYIYIYTGLMILTMISLTFFGIGNIETAEQMHASWHNLMPAHIEPEISQNERFLGWGLADSLKMNGSVFFSFGWTSELYKIIVLIVTPYIFMRFPFVAIYGKKRFPCSYGVWSAVILFQVLSQLPLWLGLSIDFGRMFMHVFVTSALYVFIMPKRVINRTFSFQSVNWVGKLNNFIDCIIPNRLLTLMFIMMFYGVGFCGYNLQNLYSNSVIGGILYSLYSNYLEFIVA